MPWISKTFTYSFVMRNWLDFCEVEFLHIFFILVIKFIIMNEVNELKIFFFALNFHFFIKTQVKVFIKKKWFIKFASKNVQLKIKQISFIIRRKPSIWITRNASFARIWKHTRKRSKYWKVRSKQNARNQQKHILSIWTVLGRSYQLKLREQPIYRRRWRHYYLFEK